MSAPQPSVVTVGVFDGLHAGHRALVDTTVFLARTEGLRSVTVTFDPHPMTVVRGLEIPLLATLARRRTLLQAEGIDQVHVCHFDAQRSQQDPRDFVQEVLIDTCGARMVVVGHGFRFGRGAAGNADTIRDAGLIVHEVPAVQVDGERVSSTRIRGALVEGDVAEATRLLGRPHRLEGVVVHGHHRGRELGYPTANIAVSEGLLVPADGVYAGWLVRIGAAGDDVERLPTAMSIGTNPTFADVMERRVEAYVLDRDDLDLYGEPVAVDLQARIRGMVRFDTMEALLAAMANDVEQSRAVLAADGGQPRA